MKYAIALLVALAVSSVGEGAIFVRRSKTVAISKAVVVSQPTVVRARAVCRTGVCGVR